MASNSNDVSYHKFHYQGSCSCGHWPIQRHFETHQLHCRVRVDPSTGWIDERESISHSSTNEVSWCALRGVALPFPTFTQSRNVVATDYAMCAGLTQAFFVKHELMQKYRWYWRIEPDVKFFCNIPQDP
ncbi:hypothetical protein BDN72DRAFT_298144 [Pluteus cervinus]|uniref:Uncharacterized protein n=1 Tax=Pluteus cervinus TaxID=181527 RepID=A0ACD3ADB3_9AGAR|nr:hypothetical protein BDN72DRAFT_298144 [Pluteus cervinus]